MRLLGHPVHVMLVHFPVALWPAHAGLHFFAAKLPAGAAASVGFWILAAGTAFGWLAAMAGMSDLVALWQEHDRVRLSRAIMHACINGPVLIGFTVLAALEYRDFPALDHGFTFLGAEVALLVVMGVGNYFGGAVIWGKRADT